ncbi:MAG: hypothetical protein RR848_07220, partial [Oscillospiraceae bacterium]
MKNIGFIGYGLRSDTMMEAFTALELDIAVAAIADPRSGELRESLSQKAFLKTPLIIIPPRKCSKTKIWTVYLSARAVPC